MKKLLFFIVISFFVTSCAAQKVQSPAYNTMLKSMLKNDVPELTVDEADSIKNNNPKVVFIDTREQKEYEVSHLENAVWVGYDDFDLSRVKSIDKDTKIIAYCSVGARSENVTRQLIEAGYTDVSNMYGSIFEWVNQGKPVYNLEGEETMKVHAYSKTWGVWLKKGEKVYE
ncbi:rhodanese-like domain-containing protein [Brumimicrobium aurantiacum]|uniref:Rhodanese-like domain-containing protein n=1 Tax=Brumimicrobium aurantiacum TaxID=1737063 RepID=A0A3E1F032_9FLAO|nr:rhodanese-like domain-containing protein [Brumimicrobium aurantiacum]RFC55083.1 rhodanese-like domain-containing protein [Brumimicrobium aurantiacum]